MNKKVSNNDQDSIWKKSEPESLDSVKIEPSVLLCIDDDYIYYEEHFEDHPTPLIRKLIRIEVLEKALAEAALPKNVHQIGTYTADIYETVGNLKASKELKIKPTVHIPRLLGLLSQALSNDDWTAIDDFVAAWEHTKFKPFKVNYGGEDYAYSDLPGRKNSSDISEEDPTMRRSLTWIVVDCIRQLQRDLGRIPFRSEIMDYVSFHRPNKSITEDELSRQLKELKFSHMIPNQTKEALKKTEEWDTKWRMKIEPPE